MKFLIMTGTLYPVIGNNANLVGKLIPYLQEKGHTVYIFSQAFKIDRSLLPEFIFGVPVCWVLDDSNGIRRKYIYPLISKITDSDGFSDKLQSLLFSEALEKLREEYSFDAVIATSEPYSMAVAASKLKNVKKYLYLMDPPAQICNGYTTPFRKRTLKSTLLSQTCIISTPFIFKALDSFGICLPDDNRIVAGFPIIQNFLTKSIHRNEDRIKLLFTGWLYSDIRSPKYFLDIVSKLDNRFQVIFMGKECEKLREKYLIETQAEIITLPQQPYHVALEAMGEADILINIGNSIPVHMPSKTLEYINTGKPIINFYKIEDCPTLFYTNRYPLALNFYEGNDRIDKVVKKFIEFCESSKGKTVSKEYILSEFKECTPEYIVDKVLEVME